MTATQINDNECTSAAAAAALRSAFAPIRAWVHRRFSAGSPHDPTAKFLDVAAALLDPPTRAGELSGWPLMRRSRRSGPTVYTVLERLEAAGWVTSRWVIPDSAVAGARARSRSYQLTAAGTAGVRALLAAREVS